VYVFGADLVLPGLMNKTGKKFNDEMIVKGMKILYKKGNKIGADFAAYGIYSQYKNLYCFYKLYDNKYDNLLD